jgi:rhomboid protease GluP
MRRDPLSVSSKPEKPGKKIISQILSEIYNRFHLDLSQDPVAMERIDEAVQLALGELENQAETVIKIPFITANATGPIHLEISVSRDALGLEISPESPLDIPVEGPPDVRPDDELIFEEPVPQRTRIDLPDRKPMVTTSLMVITIIIYILQLLTDFFLDFDLPALFGMKINELIVDGQYWRLITPMFLHGSLIHLGFNMYALNILGRRVERFFGSYRFLALYLVAGIAGNVFSFFFTTAPSLGSSTAIFGLLGAEGVFIYQHRQLFGEQFRAALKQIIQIAGINIVIGLSPGIDNWGHIGGLIGGAIFTWFGGPRFSVTNAPPLLKLEDKSSPELSLTTFVVLVVVLIGLVIAIISYK